MPTALKMIEQYGDDLTVLFCESQGATDEQAEACMLNHKWFGDKGIWTTEHPFDTGSRGLPSAALLGNNGEVLWVGSPTSDHKKIVALVEEQIKLAKKSVKALSPALQKALNDFNAGSYAAAFKALDEMKDGPDKDAAKKLGDSLTTRAKLKLARLQWLIDSADFDEADKLAPQLVTGFEGHAYQEKAKQLATTLGSKEMEKEREAARALSGLRKRIAKDGLDDAIKKSLSKFAEKFPDTRAAKVASHLATVAETKPS